MYAQDARWCGRRTLPSHCLDDDEDGDDEEEEDDGDDYQEFDGDDYDNGDNDALPDQYVADDEEVDVTAVEHKCSVCNESSEEEEEVVVVCAGCGKGYHLKCHAPILKAAPESAQWICASCVLDTNAVRGSISPLFVRLWPLMLSSKIFSK